MKKLFSCCFTTLFLLPTVVLAEEAPVETRINKVRVGGSLSFNYDRPIFKGINSTTGYSLVPRLSLGPVRSDEENGSTNRFKGPLKFMLKPRFGFFKQGYDASDSVMLRGMKDRDSSFNLGLKFHTRTPVGSFVLEGGYDVSGKHDGFEGSFMYTNLIPLGASRLRLYPEIGVYYWSKRVSDYYFGVNLGEVLVGMDVTDDEIRPAYDLESTTNYFLGYRLEYPLSKKWGLTHTLRSTWFDDQIKDSPITEDDMDNDVKATFGVTYDF
ncbi:MipA/OmpV family protein [Leucothrix sargassi]|nr:MipA/OmpV family protein [Leucothrix sargassi]